MNMNPELKKELYADATKFHVNTPSFVDLRDGNRLAYQVFGNAASEKKLLFIMGFLADHTAWHFQIEYFSALEDYQLVVFDNRGIGKSSVPSKRYTTRMMAEDAIELIDHLGWSRVHVIGASMGGMIALEFCHGFPDRVLSMSILVTHGGGLASLPGRNQIVGIHELRRCNTLENLNDRVHALLRCLYSEKHLASESKYESVSGVTNRDMLYLFHSARGEKASLPSKTGLINQLLAIMTHYVSNKRLYEIRNCGFPILVISASDDRIVHPRNSQMIAEALESEHTKYIVFDAGHGVNNECHIQLNDELNNTFLKAHSSTLQESK